MTPFVLPSPADVQTRAHVAWLDDAALTFDGKVGDSTEGSADVAPGAKGEPKVNGPATRVLECVVPGPAGCVPVKKYSLPALPTVVVIASMRAFSSAAE